MYIEDVNFLSSCKGALLQCREETLNHLNHLNSDMKSFEKDDSAGAASHLQEETYRLSRGASLSSRLKEIDEALSRLESGDYGYCVETEEPIEKGRLQALPWTNLSLAGAEIRERNAKKR